MATAQEIITAALARSAAADPSALATEGGELLRALGRALQRYYLLSAELAPDFFGAVVDVGYTAASAGALAGWVRPVVALSVRRLESVSLTNGLGAPIASGTKVEAVAVDDRRAALGDPSLYEYGRRWIPTGQTIDPAGGTLRVFYSAAPTLPSALTSAVDATWPEEHNSLLIADLARYLALKEGREGDLMALETEVTEELSLFRARIGAPPVVVERTRTPGTKPRAGGGA